MPAAQRIGIVGTGMGGLTLATMLAGAGIAVDILEQAIGPSALGSGLTLRGNAVRVLRELEVLEELLEHGYAFNDLALRAPGPEAKVLAVLDDMRVGGDDLPATIGIYRPELNEIVRRKAEEAGVELRYGAKVTGLTQTEDAVEVTTESGKTYGYDVVVGADGLNSTVREAIGITEKPQPTGMGIWRTFVPRPEKVVRTDLYYGGPAFIAGYCPTGESMMYAYLVEAAQDRDVADGPAIMAELASGYGGPWVEIRECIKKDARVNYTHFTQHLVDGDWHRGRVVLIGDAAHSCPPTIAQGAAMAIEDAAVLAREIIAAAQFDEAIFRSFRDQRVPRARVVVENSVQLGQWMLEGKRDGDVPGLMHQVDSTVRVPV